MSRFLLCIVLVAAGTLCRASVVLSIDPSSQIVATGSQATFNIDISGLGNGTALGTYDLNFGFDPSLLSYSSATFGNDLDVSGLGDVQSVTPGSGTVDLFELSLDSAALLTSLQPNSFTLATLKFSTLAAGSNSPVTLSINALGDENGNALPATIQDGSVTIEATTPPPVSSVPEPSSALVVAGFLALSALRLGNAANLPDSNRVSRQFTDERGMAR